MATSARITVDAVLKARIADLSSQAGQDVDEFVGSLRRRVAEATALSKRRIAE